MDNSIEQKKVLAIFDFDKTLVRIDSFRLLADMIAGGVTGRLWCLWLAVVAKCGAISNTLYKERILETFWFSKDAESQAAVMELLEQRLHAEGNSEVIDRMWDHVRRGDATAVISASPDFIIEPFMQALCPDVQVYGSTVSYDGTLATMNNLRGERKIAVARELIEEHRPTAVVVYTDHISDLPLVRLCNRAVLVRPSRRFVQEVEKLSLEFETIR